MQYRVKTEVFQGPVELLLEMVEKRKLFVNDVSLAEVADDYMRHISNLPNIPLRDTAQFIVVASTLLLIKSRSLLPNLELTQEEECDISDLKKRLMLYKEIKRTSKILEKRFNKTPLISPKKSQPLPKIFTKPEDLSTNSLLDTVKSIIKELPVFLNNPEVSVSKSISLPEMIQKLKYRIENEIQTRFHSIANKSDKYEFIVSFLALLELMSQGSVSAKQKTKFGDIEIESKRIGMPAY